MKDIKLLQKYLKHWQSKLNLDDWDLSIKLTDFNRTDFIQTGDVKVDTKNKKAVVLIANDETGKDVNKVILHELVHLLLWDLDHYAEKHVPDKKEYLTLLEKTVGDITERIFHE